MNCRTFVPLGILTLSLLIGAGALATYAREEPPAGQAPVIGSVDMRQVYENSDAPQLVLQKDNDEAQRVIQLSTRIQATPYFEPQELGEYLNLITAPNRNAAQETRLQELTTLSGKREQELNALRSKKEADLTADDKTHMQQLQQEDQRFQSLFPRIQNSLQLDEQTRVEAFHHEQMQKLGGIVGKVAAARGITDVWDSVSLVYSNNDLTAEVIRTLKKK